jgi:hypothetical protein
MLKDCRIFRFCSPLFFAQRGRTQAGFGITNLGSISDYIDNFVGDDAHIVPQEITPYNKRGDVGIAPYNITI